jgi:hypothetical protein
MYQVLFMGSLEEDECCYFTSAHSRPLNVIIVLIKLRNEYWQVSHEYLSQANASLSG